MSVDNGEKLSGLSYLLAYHSDTTHTCSVPLTYEAVLIYDKVRSKRLGLAANDIKTHDRRRSLPAEILCLDEGNDLVIRAMARWSLRVISFYADMSETAKADIQIKALNHAESRFRTETRAPKFSYSSFVF